MRIPGVSLPAAATALFISALASVELGVRVFANNDEARFPLLADGMLRGGPWFRPELNGIDYLNKPPLFAWLIAALSWQGHRVTELTAVLPSALAGIATALLVYRIGFELHSERAGRYAALIAATTQGLFLHERLPLPDMLLVALETGALWMLARMWRHPDSRAWIGCYGLIAAAFWTKGLAALLPVGVALFLGFLARRARGFGWLRLGRGTMLLVVLTAPWWIVGLVSDASSLHRAVVIDQIFWYLPHQPTIVAFTVPFQHIVGILFPWVLLAPWALLAAWRGVGEQTDEGEPLLFTVAWAAAAFALIAPSHEQRLRYYLPLVAPLTLLIGWWLAGLMAQSRPVPRIGWRPYAAGGALLALGTAVSTVLRIGGLRPEAQLSVPASATELLMLGMSGGLLLAAILAAVWRGRPRAVLVAVLAAAVLVGGLYHNEVARLNRAYDVSGTMQILRGRFDAAAPLAAWDVPALPLAFYLGRPVTGVKRWDQIEELGSAGAPVAILAGHAAAASLTRLAGVRILGEERVGGQPVLLASFSPAPLAGRASPPVPPAPIAAWHSAAAIATEISSVFVALIGCAVRHAGSSSKDVNRVRLGGALAIVALAAFPQSWVVLALGAVVAVAWCYSVTTAAPRLSTPACLGLILMLPLGLDAIEDLLDARPVSPDALWLATAAIGTVLLLAVSRRRGLT
ncbi:MAG: hypothetical protein C5B48_15480 [Candidatus Rokuibacteriota bacterium]|nr:MAG: hypothetical protein C5B48_15480 [Candidatus Rokubacteria bacterium]